MITQPDVKKILEKNLKIDKRVLSESMLIVSALRKSGLQKPCYNLSSPHDTLSSQVTFDPNETDRNT